MPLVRSILSEYGLRWAINRTLYSGKLKLLRTIPQMEKAFEKDVHIKRIDGLFRPNAESIAALLEQASDEEKHALLFNADEALCGRIKGFSAITLDYGNPIDWQLNPITNGRCSERNKWYTISDFDKRRGDIKAVWEISRFTHFYLFSRAYLLSGDEKYYRGFSSQLSDWIDKNPYGYGANFKCGQECALRMVNGLIAYAIFRKHGLITAEDEQNIRSLVERCYKKVLSNFYYAYRCIKNNHTLSELMGMIVGAWCCEDDKTLNKAYRILDNVIAEQFTNDGGYCQYSFNYQRMALQILSHILSFSNQTGRKLSAESVALIQKSVLLMAQCMNTTGDLPNYGSNDGALIIPNALSGYRNFRPAINAAYALTVGKRLWADRASSEQLLWHGVSPPAAIDFMPSGESFAEAGLFTLRNRKIFVMAILNHYRSRPGHMDQMHIDVWTDDCNILSDSGTYSYADETGQMLASGGAHNVVMVDGLEQMNQRGKFMVCDWTKRLHYECTRNTFLGEMNSQNGYTHKRQITLAANAIFVEDTVDSCGKRWKSMLHTPMEAQRIDASVILKRNGRPVARIDCGTGIEVMPCMQSLYYLRTDPATQIALICPEGMSNIHWSIHFMEAEEK